MNNNNARYSIAFGVAVIAAMVCGSGAVAQDTVNGVADASVELDIQAQPIGDALNALAQQSGLQVVFFSEVAGDLQSREAVGEFESSEVALEYLLADTGLGYRFVNERTVAIGEAADQGGASDSKNLTPQPVLMVQTTSQTATTSSRSEEGGTSIVTGKVTDARTGANLKGAKISIEETGQWTSTNDLGEFRFVNVPTGNATLTVSFLGYAGQTAGIAVHGESTSQDFALRGGSEIEEIVVFGQRSARALALNQERTAENFSTVLSADFLGSFDGTTIAESLRRAPGIAFQQDGVTGDGTNIIIRGLSPDFNMVTLNGVRLPDGSGVGRASNLNNLLTESISKITVSKTLLPSHDSIGTGGLVEIETKSPLERPETFLSLGAEKGQTGDDFLDDLLISGTASQSFGESRRFGLSASMQYRERKLSTVSYSLSPGAIEYFPLATDGSATISSLSQIDPREPFPFGDDVDVYPSTVSNSYSETDVRNVAATLSAQLLIGDHTDLRLDFQHSHSEQDRFRASLDVAASTGYELLPIGELDDEQRIALVMEDAFASFGLLGSYVLPQNDITLTRDIESATDVFSLQGTTQRGPWTLEYNVGHANGENETPERVNMVAGWDFSSLPSIDPTWFLPAAADRLVDGRLVNLYRPISGRQYPLALLNQSGFDFYNNAQNYAFSEASTATVSGENERRTAALSVRRTMANSSLQYIEAGVFSETARFESLNAPSALYFGLGGVTLQGLGLPLSANNLDSIGLSGGFNSFGRHDFEAFVDNLDSFTSGADAQLFRFDLPIDPRLLRASTEEDEIAAYIQARFVFGPVEVIGGARLVDEDVRAVNLTGPRLVRADGSEDLEFANDFSGLVTQRGSHSDVLPRVLVNYRQTENLIYRFAYYLSVARPSIRDLSSQQDTILNLQPTSGPAGNQPSLFVRQGNPNLKPATTDNFDASVEYYDDNLGVLKLSVFYKDIENFLENNTIVGTESLDGVLLPDHPSFNNLPSNLFVEIQRPVNSPFGGYIWGAEVAFEKQLTTLPAPWDGLGIYANYTHTESSKTEVFGFIDPATGQFFEVPISDVSFNQQPEDTGTLAFTYNKNNLDASLAYTKQSRRLGGFGANNLSFFEESDETLDFRAEYHFAAYGANNRLYVEVSDILKGRGDPDVEGSQGGIGGTPRYFVGGNYFGGRVFRVGFVGAFGAN